MNIYTIFTTLKYLQDPNWSLSLGEDYNMIHFRNKHKHALINPVTGVDTIHYDEIDPYESPESLVNHMWESKKGKKVIKGIIAAAVAYLLGK